MSQDMHREIGFMEKGETHTTGLRKTEIQVTSVSISARPPAGQVSFHSSGRFPSHCQSPFFMGEYESVALFAGETQDAWCWAIWTQGSLKALKHVRGYVSSAGGRRFQSRKQSSGAVSPSGRRVISPLAPHVTA